MEIIWVVIVFLGYCSGCISGYFWRKSKITIKLIHKERDKIMKELRNTISIGTSAEPFSVNRKFMVDKPLFIRRQSLPLQALKESLEDKEYNG